MKVVFLSNYLTHHQTEFCENLLQQKNIDFCFIQTEEMSIERKKMGWCLDISKYPYVLNYGKHNQRQLKKILLEAQVIILGDSKIDVTQYRLDKNVLILFYRERLFKQKKCFQLIRRIKLWIKYSWKYRKYNTISLCASAYASKDFSEIWSFSNRCFKWGYFPELKKYDVDELLKRKQQNSKICLLWTGRFIYWKRVGDVLEVAKRLRDLGVDFQLNIIGSGELQREVKSYISANQLNQYVSLKGNVSFKEVRKYMEQSNIYIMTSNQEEGWGVVVNEAMNSACSVIGSSLAGAVPYLITDGENGLIYKCGDIEELTAKVLGLINNPLEAVRLGKNAYYTIMNTWNAKIASKRLIQLIEFVKDGKGTPFTEGPCSLAEIIDERKELDE